MTSYDQSKKARRVASVVYLTIMGVIFIGTYLSNEQKATAKKDLSSAEVITSIEKHEKSAEY